MVDCQQKIFTVPAAELILTVPAAELILTVLAAELILTVPAAKIDTELEEETLMSRVITISREFGSGGRTIGKKVAEKLNIPCYDAELITKIAEKSGFDQEYLTRNSEENGGGWLGNVFIRGNYYGRSNEDYIWQAQSEVILDLASKEDCVIVGRCADYILKGKADLLTVFIHASEEKRIERITNVYGIRAEDPAKRLRDKDKRRKAYHRFYTETEWGRAKHYTICLDSGEIGIDRCAEIIASLY